MITFEIKSWRKSIIVDWIEPEGATLEMLYAMREANAIRKGLPVEKIIIRYRKNS